MLTPVPNGLQWISELNYMWTFEMIPIKNPNTKIFKRKQDMEDKVFMN